MRPLLNRTSGLLRLKVTLVIIILGLWTANTVASASPRYTRCLFDLSIEELMEIRIDAGDWPWGCFAASNEAPPEGRIDDCGLTSVRSV